MIHPPTSPEQVSTTDRPQDTTTQQQAPDMTPQFKLKQPWKAPVYHQAFSPQPDDDPPPGPTPLLTPAPLIIFVPAANTSLPATALPAFHPSSIIELRHLAPNSLSLTTTPQVYAITPTHALPPATYHTPTLFDLRLTLADLTPAQRRAIRTLKLRWATAQCALWECHHPEHASRTCVNVFALLEGLEGIVVDCEGRAEGEVRGVKEDLVGWVEGLGVSVVMEGGMVEEKGGKWWESGVGWAF